MVGEGARGVDMTTRGSALPQSKLTERVVPVLRELHVAGITTRRLGRGLGVNHTTVWLAVTTYPQLQADGRVQRRYLTWDHVR